ncbi:hypothetical protein OIU77_016027 [Salix suchowensis]|uniref:Serine acetyltransferase N-terminal domain-containing protein n=1 Tax=Salix suchowensis TaxID=1278906 RepID=A0ABQ8ZIZ7_9ROSI|nr:hypothetical protein OIU77_016027 [Salix suchowensis]
MAACFDTQRTDTSQLSRNPNRSQSDDQACNYVKFCGPPHVPCTPFYRDHTKPINKPTVVDDFDQQNSLWRIMNEEARLDVEKEPILSSYYFTSILSHKSLERALANVLSIKLSNSSLPSTTLFDLFAGVLEENPEIMRAVEEDLKSVRERDPACVSFVHSFLNFKGFLACQAHRVAHKLWSQGRQNSSSTDTK